MVDKTKTMIDWQGSKDKRLWNSGVSTPWPTCRACAWVSLLCVLVKWLIGMNYVTVPGCKININHEHSLSLSHFR